jgi:hypothetical protein
MDRDNAIDHALEIAKKSLVLVATSDEEGVPHIAAANSIGKPEAGRIAVTDWFCPETVANATSGRSVAIVIWDSVLDEGHQIVGRVAAVEELAIMNGYLPGEDERVPLPQQERRLIIDVEKVMAFRQAFHSDIEE